MITLSGDGADRIDGGEGKDTISYLFGGVITIDLSDTDENGIAVGEGGGAEGDKMSNIENIIGTFM